MIDVTMIGSGGREHAIGKVIAGSPEVGEVYFSPGNAGSQQLPNGHNIPVAPHCANKLTIIGPEQPLVDGLADQIRHEGGLVFGPSAVAAKLEGSKAHATRFMQDAGIPHPDSIIVHELSLAERIVGERNANSYVIKADGLAGGKGVVLPDTHEEALKSVRSMMSGELFGDAGRTIVIQDRYNGPEVSAFVISDGDKWTMLPLIQDHKRLGDGNTGPNTGGMGACGPVPDKIVNEWQYQKILDIAETTITAMSERNEPYQGVLYIGIMLAEEHGGDPVVIEYNVRFGDPDTQPLMLLLQNSGVDVFDLLLSSAEGSLRPPNIDFRNIGHSAISVCLAAKGYPNNPENGEVIFGLKGEYDNVTIHHGGTVRTHNGRRISSTGGRVLHISAINTDIDSAAHDAYKAIGRDNHGVWFEGMQYRKDIGHQARTVI